MAGVVREKLARPDDARALLRDLYLTPVDLVPDLAASTLTVRVHHQAAALQDAAAVHLCAELNATGTIFSRHRTSPHLPTFRRTLIPRRQEA